MDRAELERLLADLESDRVERQESISRVLFASALRLARQRGLAGPGGDELRAKRRDFALELGQAIRRVDAIEALVRARHAGILE